MVGECEKCMLKSFYNDVNEIEKNSNESNSEWGEDDIDNSETEEESVYGK